MIFYLRKITCLSIVFASCSLLFSQHVQVQQLDSLFDYLESKQQSIGAVSVFHHGQEIYARNFGQVHLPITVREQKALYHIGSVTKVFTSVLIWKLIEQNKLQLSTSLADFYSFVPHADKIQIKHLLSHTSGLARNYWKTSKEGVPLSNQVILKNIIKGGLLFETDSNVAYSNNAFYLLKGIVETKYEKPFGQIVMDEIVQPLQLQNIYSIEQAPSTIWNSYRYNYKKQAWQKKQDFYFSNIVGVGDMVADMTNLNAFFYQLMQGKILSNESVKQMMPEDEQDFGMNLQNIHFYEFALVGHGGTTVGTHTLMAYEPISQLQFSISINGEICPHNEVYLALLGVLFYQKLVLPYCVEPSELSTFVGTFRNNELKHTIKIGLHEFAGIYGEDTKAKLTFPLRFTEKNLLEFQQLQLQFKEDFSAFTLYQAGAAFVFSKVK